MDLDHQERLRRFTAGVMSDGGLESLGGDDGAVEALSQEAPPELVTRTFEHVRTGRDLSVEESDALEAIILPRYRPALIVADDSYDPPPWPWVHLDGGEFRDRIEGVIPSVGRVELPDRPSVPYGGTAFVVGDGLLMTNRHVAALFASGLGRRRVEFLPGQSSAIDFKREGGSRDRVVVDVAQVVMIHPFWDMAVLRVEGLDPRHRPLTLAVAHPDDLKDREVVIVGYPAQDARNDAELQQQIFGGRFGIKRLQPGKVTGVARVVSFGNDVDALAHDSSTLGGNSGSAVIDCVTGEVVGLHFAGRYLEANYAVPAAELARDSIVVDAGVRFAGAALGSPDPWARGWQRADEDDEDAATAAPRARPAVGPVVAAPSHEVIIEVPLRIRVSVDAAVAPSAVADDEVEGVQHPWGTHKLTISPDPDYDNRTGYDSKFLGTGPGRVKVPRLSDAQYRDVTPNGWDDSPKTRHLLPYHHYSVCMCRSRRLAWFTAGNIDGRHTVTMKREWFTRDRWHYDPRIPRSAQVGDEAYASNPFDRGHVLRRLDTVWGLDFGDAKKGNDDTFHWTNCSPQHERFNRGYDLWLGVESFVLDQAKAHDLKVSVFSGPVLTDDDPPYRDLRLPRSFWKVVVYVREDSGELSSSGYLLTQSDLLTGDLKEAVEGVFDDWNGFQVSVASIEELTGLDFRKLRERDSFTHGTDESVAPAVARPLRSFSDLQL